jgi:hypothetical protein
VDQDCLDKETEENVRAIPWAAELIRLHATTLTQATHNSGNCENLAVIFVLFLSSTMLPPFLMLASKFYLFVITLRDVKILFLKCLFVRTETNNNKFFKPLKK